MRPSTTARHASFSLIEALLCFAISSSLTVLFAWKYLGQVLRGELINPDSYMRVVRLAETLRAGIPVDVVQREGAGAGFALHWSHLLDMLLLLLAAPLRLIWPTAAAEGWSLPPALHWAAVASGPLAVGALSAAAVWACAPFADREWRWFAALAIAVAYPVLGYGMPGVVHHHVLLAVIAVMTTGWTARASKLGGLAGWRTGVWGGVGIWLSPETVVFTLFAVGGLGVAWLTIADSPKPRRALSAAGPGLLLVVTMAYAIDPGTDGWSAIALDRISLAYVSLALAICAIGFFAAAIDRVAPRGRCRMLLGIAVAVFVSAAWIAAFPAVLRGPEGIVADANRAAFFDHISEMQPVASVADFAGYLLGGTLAAALAIAVAVRRRSLTAGYVAVCAIAVLAVAFRHIRFATYASVMGAIALPVMLTLVSRKLAAAPALGATMARLACQFGFLLVPYLPQLAIAAPIAGPACGPEAIRTLLTPYGDEVVLAQVDETPELLFHSGVRTVGSLYHRNFPGFLLAYTAWRSAPSQAEPVAVQATNATLLLACPGRPRSALVADLPPDTLFDRLNSGTPPPWLELAAKDPVSGWILYRVRRQ